MGMNKFDDTIWNCWWIATLSSSLYFIFMDVLLIYSIVYFNAYSWPFLLPKKLEIFHILRYSQLWNLIVILDISQIQKIGKKIVKWSCRLWLENILKQVEFLCCNSKFFGFSTISPMKLFQNQSKSILKISKWNITTEKFRCHDFIFGSIQYEKSKSFWVET